mgnify:CR=1 FL=1
MNNSNARVVTSEQAIKIVASLSDGPYAYVPPTANDLNRKTLGS